MNRILTKTADQSLTLLIPDLQEHYHSIHGARTESEHVFIQAGLELALRKHRTDLHLLEVGFGTGLNAFLTLQHAAQSTTIHYHTLEPHLLDKNIWEKLCPDAPENMPVWSALHLAIPETEAIIRPGFLLKKMATTIQEFNADIAYHLVYYDAFGPRAQPDMWTELIFKKLYACMAEEGILVTYCAKGGVRRMLTECGFKVERLPGPPGKREMLRAIKYA